MITHVRVYHINIELERWKYILQWKLCVEPIQRSTVLFLLSNFRDVVFKYVDGGPQVLL